MIEQLLHSSPATAVTLFDGEFKRRHVYTSPSLLFLWPSTFEIFKWKCVCVYIYISVYHTKGIRLSGKQGSCQGPIHMKVEGRRLGLKEVFFCLAGKKMPTMLVFFQLAFASRHLLFRMLNLFIAGVYYTWFIAGIYYTWLLFQRWITSYTIGHILHAAIYNQLKAASFQRTLAFSWFFLKCSLPNFGI